MPELNFEKDRDAKAVAIVRGGDDDGRILYLHTESKPKTCGGAGKEVANPMRYMKELAHIPHRERVKVMSELMEGVERGKAPALEDERARKVYEDMSTSACKSGAINLPDDSIFQCIPDPDPKARQVWYVAGISGSGKSYFARNIAEAYKKIFPDREVYLISKYPVEEDDTLGKMKVGRPKSISLDSLVTDYPSIEEFKDCLLIADDYDTLSAPYDKIVQKLIDDLAIRGRHTSTSMLVLSHYLTNYKKTRLILSEAHYIVLYPMATSFKAMAYVCEHHCGLTKEEVHSLKRLGRWVALHKVFPQYLISSHKACLLNQ